MNTKRWRNKIVAGGATSTFVKNPGKFDPSFLLPEDPAVLGNHSHKRAGVPLAIGKFRRKLNLAKNITVKKCKVSVWRTWPPYVGLVPQWTRALYRDPIGAHCSERIVAITAAIAEKSEFEKINLAPSSGEIGIELVACAGRIVEYYNT